MAPAGDAEKGESMEDESEDLNELLADTNGFISNKKITTYKFPGLMTVHCHFLC